MLEQCAEASLTLELQTVCYRIICLGCDAYTQVTIKVMYEMVIVSFFCQVVLKLEEWGCQDFTEACRMFCNFYIEYDLVLVCVDSNYPSNIFQDFGS